MYIKSAGIRAVIAKVSPGKLQRVSASGRPREFHADRELWQQYGHASWPLPGAEGIMVFLNGDVNNAHMIATEDRRYRPALAAAGEAATYTDEGDFVWLKRGNLLHIYSKVKVKIQSAGDIEATAATKITASAPEIDATATTKAVITAPLITLNGEVSGAAQDGVSATTYNLKGTVYVQGDIHATGDVYDGVRAMSGDRAIYNQHKHGTSATPLPQE